jgi:hypothetical protein
MASSKSDKKKPSVSGQPSSAAIVTVPGSALDFYTNSNYLAYTLPQYAAAGNLGSDKIGDDIPDEDEGAEGLEGAEGAEGEEGEESETNKRPSLSDIEVVSNEVVFDAANNPTTKIVFKVKNSSGVDLKTIQVRVERK